MIIPLRLGNRAEARLAQSTVFSGNSRCPMRNSDLLTTFDHTFPCRGSIKRCTDNISYDLVEVNPMIIPLRLGNRAEHGSLKALSSAEIRCPMRNSDLLTTFEGPFSA